MILIENLLPKTYQQDLINLFLHSDINWYYHWGTNAVNEQQRSELKINSISDENTHERPQFSHSLMANGNIVSPHYASVYPMLYFLEEKTGYKPKLIHRIKANLLYKDATYPDNAYHEAHTDFYDITQTNPAKMSTLVYYIHETDGDTFFFNETMDTLDQRPNKITVADRVSPKQGSAVLFPSNVFHASSSPRFHDRRVILNFVMSE